MIFLTELFNSGFSYSAINTARSALSAIETSGTKSIGSHPLICRFLKGVYEEKPPKPKYSTIWDVSLVLKYFQNIQDNHELSMGLLTKKVFTILLLVTAQRLQTISLIRTDCVHITGDSCEIEIVDKIKTSKPGSKNVGLKIQRYHDKKLCALSALEEYMKRTVHMRRHCEKLFLCYKKPYGEASKDTMANWVKKLLFSIGIVNYGPHSCRAAASSAMLSTGVPLDDIMFSAGWQNAQTFHRFYNRSNVNTGKKQTNLDTPSIMTYFKKLL